MTMPEGRSQISSYIPSAYWTWHIAVAGKKKQRKEGGVDYVYKGGSVYKTFLLYHFHYSFKFGASFQIIESLDATICGMLGKGPSM
jgi:hypothetical protein